MLDQAAYEHIVIDRRDDGVVLATLNRPDRLNAVNGVLHGELARLPREFDADPDARRARDHRCRAGVLRRR